MKRGGKRSATPLWVSIHAESRIESAVVAESSAGALQIADAPLWSAVASEARLRFG